MGEGGHLAELGAMLDRLAPDIGEVWRRFRFALVFSALGTALAIAGINDWLPDDAFWVRLELGLILGFVLAVGGRLFGESRPRARIAGLLVGYAVPILGLAVCQVDSASWVFLPALPVAATMWMSVAASTGTIAGAARAEAQDRFWWLNHRAVTTGAITVIAVVLVLLGVAAIERSLALLFGLDVSKFLYRGVTPFVAGFLAPAYWLSSLPLLDDFAPDDLRSPDFLSRAVGFLGQFVLTPLLTVYALILLAYAVQIAVTWSLPKGTLGWMVSAFTVTGAANWLLLHPEFMRERGMVRFFRRFWFLATLLPLVLFFIGLTVRIGAYGLTSERILLAAGGVWATFLALAFIFRRGDIRLIPALAGLMFLVLGLGPLNVDNLAIWNQAQRFEGALANTETTAGQPQWSAEQAAIARSAVEYLGHSRDGSATLRRVLAAHDIALKANPTNLWATLAELNLPRAAPGQSKAQYLTAPTGKESWNVDLSKTPVLVGDVNLSDARESQVYGLTLQLHGSVLSIQRAGDGASEQAIELAGWISRQTDSDGILTDPYVGFSFGGQNFALIVRTAYLERDNDGSIRMISLQGAFFADQAKAESGSGE